MISVPIRDSQGRFHLLRWPTLCLWTVFPLSKPLSYLSERERQPVEDARTRGGHVKSEAQIAVMQPQAKECLELPEAERGL